MEKLQGPINPCLIGEDLDVGWLEDFVSNIGSNYTFEDPYSEGGVDTSSTTTTTNYTLPSLEDKMPFLQMLQAVEAAQTPPIAPASTTPYPFMQEPSFQLLLRLQHQNLMMQNQGYGCNFTSLTTEIESCVTTNNNDMMMDMDMHSPVKSETFREGADVVVVHHAAGESDLKCSSTDLNQRAPGRPKRTHLSKSSNSGYNDGVSVTLAAPKEKRKRKRPMKPAKNKEEVESQRMTHIAVERNRRRQMNDHLNALRSLMPPSYVQRGDQASIIGGAIDFVKELEQLHQSLQAQKRIRQSEENGEVSAISSSNLLNNMIMTSMPSFQFISNFNCTEEESADGGCMEATRKTNNNNNSEEFNAKNRSTLADIEVVVIQNHVNLKIQCQRKPGQLLKAIVAFEELRLTILHLNITSLHSLVHYSFNLKTEDDCKLRSADEVARAVHQIFSLINLS